MKYVGIDPGASGAIAFITGHEYCVVKMPCVKGGLLNNRVDMHAVHGMLESFFADGHGVICFETQGVKGDKTGRAQAFSMGQNYHALLQAVHDFCSHNSKMQLVDIRPDVWKKSLGVIAKKGTNKKQPTIDLVKRIFPGADIYNTKGVPDDNRCDALAIAEYARRKY